MLTAYGLRLVLGLLRSLKKQDREVVDSRRGATDLQAACCMTWGIGVGVGVGIATGAGLDWDGDVCGTGCIADYL
ncbi:hypothetical protein BDW74DRAFT_144539 [Aspergillus multicolor]|uniref:uncharacterized protein n=1 Tax=Aspergillus multicolor TaxID=41759 RepID=UPI003CCDA9FC